MRSYPSFKRLVDFLVSAFSLLCLFPLLLLLAICVKLDTPGPVFFRQVRVTKELALFTIFKYRTMYHSDNPRSRSGFINQGESAEEANANYKRTTKDDPRITRVGKFLRNSHLDELPQLLNILAGQMSFVGPRPDVPAQVTEYTRPEWSKRHSVLPGLTGLAQIKAKLSPEQRIDLDLYYVKNSTFLLDLNILLSTFAKVLRMNSM